MTIAWMIYGAFAAGLIGIAAVAVERAIQYLRGPVRGIWCAALALSTLAVVLVPLRVTRHAEVAPSARGFQTIGPAKAPRWTADTHPVQFVAPVDPGYSSPATLQWVRSLMEPHSARVEILTAYVWFVTTLGLSVFLMVVAWHYARARDEWPIADIDGVTVHVTPHTGPAVLGFFRPWIAVPEWLLDRPAQEQQMVVDHEAEHLMARDHYLLAAGWVVIALMPWNVVAWWMVMRLRIAIELDCDRRMLHRGLSAHTYGLLLIDVASQYHGLALGTTAFASRPSQLERRIMAMKPRGGRFGRLRLTGLALAAVSALLVIGWTPAPHLDGATADPTLSDLGPTPLLTWPLGRAQEGYTSSYHLRSGWVPARGRTARVPVQRTSRPSFTTTVWALDSLAIIPRYDVTLWTNASVVRLSCVGRGGAELACVNPVCYQMDGNDIRCETPVPSEGQLVLFAPEGGTISSREPPPGIPMVTSRQLSSDPAAMVNIDTVRASSDRPQPLLGGAFHITNGRVITGDSAVQLSGNRAAAQGGVVWLKMTRQ